MTNAPANIPQRSAGRRLIDELSHDDDPYAVSVLIERAGQTADWLERLDNLLNGVEGEWLRLKVGSSSVEVMVDNTLREARQLSTELRHLLAEIYRQRANIPMESDDDDVLNNL